MNPFAGTGPSLREACSWLSDDAECIARIVEVAERNSVIEGLPPFDEELRQSIRRDLESIFNGSERAPRESG